MAKRTERAALSRPSRCLLGLIPLHSRLPGIVDQDELDTNEAVNHAAHGA